MFDRFKEYISRNRLFKAEDKILLGFSGGPDSVALAHLLSMGGYNFALAHVNFHLRGDDADLDLQFSRDMAHKLGVEFFTVDFDTFNYARENGLSIEEAARNLRYNWFDQVRKTRGFDYIATAHNADDNVETILHNLARGTGLRGLLGIPVKRGNIVRPLLFAFKDEIISFCKKNNLQYRIDKTNEQTEFTRNKIRHLIIPQFQQINPGFKNNVLRTAEVLHQVAILVNSYVNDCITEIVQQDDQDIFINKERLLKCQQAELFLFEFLYKYGFSSSQVKEAMKMINSQPGKIIKSHDYQLINDRKFLILTPIPTLTEAEFYLNPKDNNLLLDRWKLNIEVVDKKSVDNLHQPSNVALLDYDKLSFPLKIRHWQQGDYFYPLGMKGKKKLSDFFADKKIPIHKKNQVWILESGRQIVWVMGYRIDERFKITDATKKVLKIIMIEK